MYIISQIVIVKINGKKVKTREEATTSSSLTLSSLFVIYVSKARAVSALSIVTIFSIIQRNNNAFVMSIHQEVTKILLLCVSVALFTLLQVSWKICTYVTYIHYILYNTHADDVFLLDDDNNMQLYNNDNITFNSAYTTMFKRD